MDLKNKNFLKMKDFSAEEIKYLVRLSADLKNDKKKGIPHDVLRGKNIALIFEKTSTRTRCSFEVAASDLGMGCTYLDPSGSQIGKKESIADTARVLGRMYDGIEYRGFGQDIVEELAEYAGVPVWNGLTNEAHPTQMIADMLTVQEHLGKLEGVKFVYMGDARYNMGNSLMVTCAKLGMDFVACTSEKYFPDAELVAYAKAEAEKSGGSVTLTSSVEEGCKDADVIYTGQDIVEELAEYAGVPVWNGLTNEAHPTQMIADMLTVQEHLGKLEGVKFVYMGDARYNMGNSLMVTCAKLGMDFVACTSEKYFPDAELVAYAKAEAEKSGGSVTLTSSVEEGCKDADVIYTDVWVSMGEPDEVWAERIKELSPYQVNAKAMSYAKDSCIFMHCLPAFHDLKTTVGKQIHEKFGLSEMEVTDEVFESAQSVVFDEAETVSYTHLTLPTKA